MSKFRSMSVAALLACAAIPFLTGSATAQLPTQSFVMRTAALR
jgi:hypothetical protein